jgi:hypothetical protein
MNRPRHARPPMAAILCLLVTGGSAASADCRSEVEAAFQRLETPGRPYRIEITMRDQRAQDPGASALGVQTFRELDEFIPPDRMRRIMWSDGPIWRSIIDYFLGGPPAEAIQVGKRRWVRMDKGWLEEDASSPAQDAFLTGAGLPETTVACLGTVEFEGRTYAGYRTSLPRVVATLTFDLPGRDDRPSQMSKMQQDEALARLKQQPTMWRTILVDLETGLPAYQFAALANELDNPVWSRRYAYPGDITIEPPVR